MTERLELTTPEFTSRAVSFMNLMRTPAFRKQFAADPAGTALREFQLKLPARSLSSSNKLLASLLEDRAFMEWSQAFQERVEKQHPALAAARSIPQLSKDASKASAEIQREFAAGVAAHLPPGIARKLKLGKSWKGQIAAEDDIAIVLLVFVAVIVVVVAPKARDELLSRNTVRLLVNQLDILKNDPSGRG